MKETAAIAKRKETLKRFLDQKDRPLSKIEQACIQRQLDDFARGDERGLIWDEDAVEKLMLFLTNYCRHYKGKWKGQLFVPEPWQVELIIAPLYGWKRENEEGLIVRRFNESYNEIAKKNGKTLLAACLCLFMLVADGEAAANIYACATKRDQARIVFEDAKEVRRMDSELSKRIVSLAHKLEVPNNASFFKILASERDSTDGLNPSFVVCDELHQWMQKIVGFYNSLSTAGAARLQWLFFQITNAGTDRLGICWNVHNYAEKVLNLEGDRILDDSFHAYIATMDPGDDWGDERNWHKANPNLGVTVPIEFLRNKYKRALESSAERYSFLRYYLTQWVEGADSFFDVHAWDKSGDGSTVQELRERLIGRRCFCGVDLATKIDLASQVLFFPPEGDDPYWSVLQYTYIPEENILERQRVHKANYKEWVEKGFLHTTPGDVIDYDFIEAHTVKLSKKYQIISVPYDSHNATHFVQNLQKHGFEPIEVRQGSKTLSEPMKELLRLILKGMINHGNDPLLRWCIGNLIPRSDANQNVSPDREKSKAKGKIDTAVALITASAIALGNEDDEIYEFAGFG